MFVGHHEHTLDDKGRLILPSPYRLRLTDGAFVTPLDRCLAILPADEFRKMAEKLTAQVEEGSVDVNAVRAFASRADHVIPDGQGRIRLLPELRASADLDRTVIVAGALQRIEIWNPDRWRELETTGSDLLAEAITRGRGVGGS